ncbi:hypothetical protein SAMN05444422_102261 [Halobiforma haloterrestris]|uniref:DUF7490 domain-containing protein n=1 Tax=Natronobacterium haloterrestre TaxID=148448 RepID=A0A1I1E6Y6_NATHA|nr:hypothetical protein [Halobiforma haloterrestris]SFB82939.1 hypothetical protein SAMN05444422_102261 [Halobiforma haloterrestris]
MNRELALSGAALAVAVLALATLALSGAVADPAEPDAESKIEGHASLLEVTIAADDVSGETVSLEIDSYLEHRGQPVENVTVVHRATDTDTDLVEDETSREVGTLEDGGETVATATVDVPREGSYALETFVYADGTRTESATHRVYGVDALTPAYADSSLEFHRFGGEDGLLTDVPAIEYSVVDTDDEAGEATVEVTGYLTNAGDDPADDLELELKARQADSNVVADADTVSVPAVDPGKTATPSTELEVADEYAYYLDAVLWHDGTIVATDRAVADLGPDGNETDATFETADFEEDDGFETTAADAGDAENGNAADEAASADAEEDRGTDGTPGFGIVSTAFAALAAITALAATRTIDR